MLADYRCNEIKNNILSENENRIREFLNLATLNDISNFKDQVTQITNEILNQYTNSANNYLDERYKHYYTELKNYLCERFHIAFVNQTKRMIPISQKFFRTDLEKYLKESNKILKIFIQLNY